MDGSLNGDLDQWRWDPAADDFVRDALEVPPEIADEIPELSRVGGLTRDQVDRVIGPEKFARGLAKVTHWYGRTRGLESAICDENDPSFMEASAVVYKRLMDGPARHVMPYLSNADLVDLVIVSAFAVPYFQGIQAELKAKRAEVASQTQRKDTTPEDHPSRG